MQRYLTRIPHLPGLKEYTERCEVLRIGSLVDRRKKGAYRFGQGTMGGITGEGSPGRVLEEAVCIKK